MGNWAFPMNVAREKESQPAWLGCVDPLRVLVPTVLCPCRAVLFYFFPLSSINLCFLLNVDTAGSMAVVPKFMSIFNSPPVQSVSCCVGLVAAAYL